MIRILRLRGVFCRFRSKDCFTRFCLRWFCDRLCRFRRFCRRTGRPHRSLPCERQHEGFVLAFLPLFLHRKALRRTILCAYAARHAFLAVDRPLPRLSIDRDRLHRAAVLTASAEEAFLDGILHMMRILRLRHILCRFRGRSYFRRFCLRWLCDRLCRFRRFCRRTSRPHRSLSGERQHEGFVLAFLPLFLHRKALRRTILCAYAARHAFLAVDRPLPRLSIDRDRLHRAAVLTASAEEAFLDGILHMMRILRLRDVFFRRRNRLRLRRRAHARAAGQDLALIGGDSGFIFSFSPCICKGKALRRTVKRTGAAGDALVPIDRPCTVSAVDRDSVHRTGLFALAAEEAFFDFIFYMVVSHSRLCRCRRLRFLHDGLPRGSSSDLRDAANGDLCPISQVAAERETLSRAVVDTGTAVHTGFQIDAPCTVRTVDGDGARRTVSFTHAAENALHHIIDDMASVIHREHGCILRGDSLLDFADALLLDGGQNDLRLFKARHRIVRIHGEALLRTRLHTRAALDAGERIDPPLACLSIDSECAGGTASFAHAAENALADVIHHAPADTLTEGLRCQRILRGHRRLE